MNLIYTSSEENVADLVTKIRPISTYLNNEVWLKGPSLLRKPNHQWEKGRTLEELVANGGLQTSEMQEMQKEMKGKKVISLINNARTLKENNGGNIILECLKLSYNLTKVKRILLICMKALINFFSLLKK